MKFSENDTEDIAPKAYTASGELLVDAGDVQKNKTQLPLYLGAKTKEKCIWEIAQYLLGSLEEQKPRENAEICVLWDKLSMLLLQECMRHSGPVQAALLGSGEGVCGWLLLGLLGEFYADTRVYLVNREENGAESFRQARSLPEIRRMIADPWDTGLEHARCRLVLVNGIAELPEPDAVITEACRLLREDGTLICVTDGNPLVRNVFRVFFRRFREIPAAGEYKILIGEREALEWSFPETPDRIAERMDDLMARTEKALETDVDRQAWELLHGELEQSIREAAECGDTGRKIRLIDLQEQLLNRYAVQPGRTAEKQQDGKTGLPGESCS